MIVFLDTNVLLHYDFEQINWESELGAPVRQVVICWVNVEELDRLKANHPKTRRRERARRVLRLVVQTREAGAPHDLPGGSELTFYPLQPSIDFLQHNLDASNPDHRLVATALQLQTTENMPVTLITEDATPRLAAIELGISAVVPPVAFRLPASDDPAEQEIRELKRQLELERHRRPKLSVHFDRTDVLTLAWPPNPIQIHGPLLKEVIAQERERFPQPSRGFRDMDPIMIPEDAKQLERRVARYFQELPGWLNKVNEHLGVSAHLKPLSFVVRNSGSAPATDVTLDLLFPTGVEVQTKATAPAPPSPPTPPDRSKQPRRLDLVQTAARALPYGTWMGTNVSPVAVGRQHDGTWLARIQFKKISQLREEHTDPVWIEFSGQPHSFSIVATLLADESPDDIHVELPVVVDTSPISPEITADDLLTVIEQFGAGGT